jgi:hypothetical protein
VIDPQMPHGIVNRAADNWRPLCAIAEAAGGDWPERARKAILASNPQTIEDASLIELLLGDIRDVFDKLRRDRVSSAEIIENLVEIVARPWVEFGKSGKPLTQNKLARLLKPLGIGPRVVRIGDQTPSGYDRQQFDEAFERYLPEKGASDLNTSTNADATGASEPFQTSTPVSPVEVRKSQKPNNDGLCCGVEVQKGGAGHAGDMGLSIRTLDEDADWAEEFHYRHRDEPDVDAQLAQALRERLRNKRDVRPADLEIEAARVMDRIFKRPQ